MKAVSRSGRKGVTKNVLDDRGGDVLIPDDDGIVPVLFPRQTWERVKEMAESYGIRPGEVISLALDRLDVEIRKRNGS